MANFFAKAWGSGGPSLNWKGFRERKGFYLGKGLNVGKVLNPTLSKSFRL